MIKFSDVVIPKIRVGSIHTVEERALIASTTKEIGLVQDMVVRPLPDGKFSLISGRGRMEELAAAGHSEYTFKVLAADDKKALIMNIVENMARGSYDYVSVSESINELLKLGSTFEELARIFPWKKRWIEFIAGFKDLPDDVVQGLKTKQLTPTHIQISMDLPTPAEIHSGLRTAMRLSWNTGVFKVFVQNRVEEISRAKERAQSLGQPLEIPAAEPERLIQYKQCLACGFQKPASEVMVQLVCDDCMQIAKYVTANLGSTKDALQTIYAALQGYFGQQKKPAAPGGDTKAPPFVA